MTLTPDVLSPFAALAEALEDVLPPRLRGMTEVGPLTNPSSLPDRGRLILRMDPDAALWREIDRPEATPDRREAAITARLETVSPWAPGAFLWAEVPGPAERRLRLALIAAAPVRALADAAEARGGRLCEVRIGAARLRLDGSTRRRRLRFGAALWLFLMVLGAGLAGASLWLQTDAEARAAQSLTRLDRLSQDRALQSDRASAIAGHLTDARLVPELDGLAGNLPLNSYLLTLRLKPDGFQIAGQSTQPDAIVPALQAGGFQAVDFAGASALDPATGLYSFTITGQAGGAK